IEQFGRQIGLVQRNLWFRLDLRGVVEGDSGKAEQQDAQQAQRRADPVPLVQGLQPGGALAVAGRNGRFGGGHGASLNGGGVAGTNGEVTGTETGVPTSAARCQPPPAALTISTLVLRRDNRSCASWSSAE